MKKRYTALLCAAIFLTAAVFSCCVFAARTHSAGEVFSDAEPLTQFSENGARPTALGAKKSAAENVQYTIRCLLGTPGDCVVITFYAGSADVGKVLHIVPPLLEGFTAASAEAEELTVSAESSLNVVDFYYTCTETITVTITGSRLTVGESGCEQSVSGYSVEIGSPYYHESYFDFVGEAKAVGTEIGTYEMGLSAEQFYNLRSDWFPNVNILVRDGELVISAPGTVTDSDGTEMIIADEAVPMAAPGWSLLNLLLVLMTLIGCVIIIRIARGADAETVSLPGSSQELPLRAVLYTLALLPALLAVLLFFLRENPRGVMCLISSHTPGFLIPTALEIGTMYVCCLQKGSGEA